MNKMEISNPKITIGWLYPELMSTYGDRGNIIVLKKIAEDNNINVNILRINQAANPQLISTCDILFMGGAQDLQQEIVNSDLLKSKGKLLKEKIEAGTPGLYVCGAYQALGRYYQDAYGNKIEGLGIFDMYTHSFKTKSRLIGNIIIKPTNLLFNNNKTLFDNVLVGFENHGGRTFLKDLKQSFATVVKGYGNNGDDNTEGILYKNSIGTYLHGPILSLNPALAVTLLEIALFKKYKKAFKIVFNSEIATKAKETLLHRLKVAI